MITVIGIGADGWAGVPERLRERILAADVLLGGRRHLAYVPPVDGQIREPWPSPLRAGLAPLLGRHLRRDVVALASGDPLMSGVGTTFIDVLGEDRVTIEPAVSSVALAAARMRWPVETYTVVSVVGRDLRRVLRHLAPGHHLLVLSSEGATPGELAAMLTMAGWGASRLSVLGDLAAPEESRVDGRAADWADDPPAFPDLNVVAVTAHRDGPFVASWTSGLPDEAFEHDGQLTKRDLRASALARLAPAPYELLWDVGAGAGSVGIEWLRAAPEAEAVAIEADPTRAARIRRNAGRLGVPELRVVSERAPDALTGVDGPPNAVFIGGGASAPGVLDVCVASLAPGGRLVVHGVTLETEVLLGEQYARRGGELSRHHIETAAPLGTMRGFAPARAITQWAWVKTSDDVREVER